MIQNMWSIFYFLSNAYLGKIVTIIASTCDLTWLWQKILKKNRQSTNFSRVFLLLILFVLATGYFSHLAISYLKLMFYHVVKYCVAPKFDLCDPWSLLQRLFVVWTLYLSFEQRKKSFKTLSEKYIYARGSAPSRSTRRSEINEFFFFKEDSIKPFHIFRYCWIIFIDRNPL